MREPARPVLFEVFLIVKDLSVAGRLVKTYNGLNILIDIR